MYVVSIKLYVVAMAKKDWSLAMIENFFFFSFGRRGVVQYVQRLAIVCNVYTSLTSLRFTKTWGSWKWNCVSNIVVSR